jgi:putative lipoic acid-binding regulatory protein
VGRALSEDDRGRALALLEATHQFPTEYPVSVISLNLEEVVADVRAAIEHGLPQPLPDQTYETVMSRGGRYSSHRFKVPCQGPEDVLALYERLRRVKGVVTVM